MKDWRKHLRQDDEAYQAFISYIESLKMRTIREMEEAATWEAVLQARGGKMFLAIIEASLTMDAKEEAAHARAYGPARVTRSA